MKKNVTLKVQQIIYNLLLSVVELHAVQFEMIWRKKEKQEEKLHDMPQLDEATGQNDFAIRGFFKNSIIFKRDMGVDVLLGTDKITY